MEAQLINTVTDTVMTGSHTVDVRLYNSTGDNIYTKQFSVVTDSQGRFFEYLDVSYSFSDMTYITFQIDGGVETAQTMIGYVPRAVNADYLGGQPASYYTTLASGINTIKGFTASTYNGNLVNGASVGYTAGDEICAAEFSGSHFCMEIEVLKTNELYPTAGYTGTYWMKKGAPGYTAEANDCSGWTTASSLSLGPFWNYGYAGVGQGKLTNCAQLKKLACCGP